MSGSEEKSRRPDMIIRIRPPSVQKDVAFAISAGVSRRIPQPSSRKSTSAMVPTEKAKPTMWKHSRIGNDSADSLSGFSISNIVPTSFDNALYHPRQDDGHLQGSLGD